MLTPEAAVAFWDMRHRQQAERSGGDLGYDEAGNNLFYWWRIGQLVQIAGDMSSTLDPMDVLDAGCGKGIFSRAMAAAGHRVDAIDPSANAIEYCRERGGPAHYERSLILDWHPAWPYDFIYSVDVFFHLLDDALWEASLRHLASLVRLGGQLVLSDWSREERRQFGDYQVVRPPSDYHRVLEPLGLVAVSSTPYRFRHSPVAFHVFARTA
jgi:2-polyprenyl-3-methyl-5-hydroxy-6-metoxy-1,4-benzoquinol methylase